MQIKNVTRCILFDWGDTLMRVFPEFDGPMVGWPRVEAMPFASEILAELHLRYVQVLATNAADSEESEIRAALDRVGLEERLDEIYCFRKIGHKKPSKEFFEYILSELGIEQSQAVMVGDDFEADVIGANKCGIRAIWYNPGTAETHKSLMHQTVHDLRALPQSLDSFW